MLETLKTWLSTWFKKLQYVIFTILVITVLALVFFPEKVLSLKSEAFQTPKDAKTIEIWINLNREVRFVDKSSGTTILILGPELAKQVMVSQLKLYKIEELEALK